MARTLQEEYSLAWLHVGTVYIALILGNLFYILSCLSSTINTYRSRVNTMCDTLTSLSSQLYNKPQTLITASMNAIQTVKDGVQMFMLIAITVSKACVIWFVQMYKSTYRCLLGLAIHIVLSVLIKIAGPLQKISQDIASLFTGSSSPLSDWTGALQSVQDNLDRWSSDSDDLIQKVIESPFSMIESQLNQTIRSWEPAPFNLTSFQGPEICDTSELLTALSDMEYKLGYFIKWIIGFVFVLLVVFIFIRIFLIRFQHRRLVELRSLLRTALSKDGEKQVDGDELLRLYDQAASVRLLVETQAIDYKPRHRFIQFMSHPTVLYCLIVGVLGVLLINVLIWALESKSKQLIQAFFDQSSSWITNAMSTWITTVNNQVQNMDGWINQAENDINEKTIGVIKNLALQANNALAGAVQDIQQVIQKVFGGTLLEEPAQGLVKCLVINRIDAVGTGLAWIANASYISLDKLKVSSSFNASTALVHMSNVITDSFYMDDNIDILSGPLKSLLWFYYILLLFWLIVLVIAICFQIKYRYMQ
ncbi:plasma membrane fusion protein prm1 [Rhizopus azygosporus]|uniref:Plasma membrane fusion protein PRM1 n=1 Tax=Rhizopus azygosporus TaxID=86630 RepID=A0A367KAT6_RHIAZ|nr:plasma membrane fusion protein prm1 [Rhizopus azygosporus]